MVFMFFPVVSHAQESIWLFGKFREVRSASPLIGEASFTLPLARALAAAIPVKYLNESKQAGFDIETISNIIEAMPGSEPFELTKNDYYLSVQKQVKSATAEAKASYLVIKSNKIKIPIPLIVTGVAVKALQLAFKDFSGMDEPLSKFFEEIKKTPPGLLLKGEDQLMNEWLEIRLE